MPKPITSHGPQAARKRAVEAVLRHGGVPVSTRDGKELRVGHLPPPPTIELADDKETKKEALLRHVHLTTELGTPFTLFGEDPTAIYTFSNSNTNCHAVLINSLGNYVYQALHPGHSGDMLNFRDAHSLIRKLGCRFPTRSEFMNQLLLGPRDAHPTYWARPSWTDIGPMLPDGNLLPDSAGTVNPVFDAHPSLGISCAQRSPIHLIPFALTGGMMVTLMHEHQLGDTKAKTKALGLTGVTLPLWHELVGYLVSPVATINIIKCSDSFAYYDPHSKDVKYAVKDLKSRSTLGGNVLPAGSKTHVIHVHRSTSIL